MAPDSRSVRATALEEIAKRLKPAWMPEGSEGFFQGEEFVLDAPYPDELLPDLVLTLDPPFRGQEAIDLLRSLRQG